MSKYKRIIVLISIIGVVTTSMISVIISCLQTDASPVDQTNNKAKKVESEDTEDDSLWGIMPKEIQRRETEYNRFQSEKRQVYHFCSIVFAQTEFKKQRVKDQNKNGIGEYASNTELVDFIKTERKKKSEVSKRLLPDCSTKEIGAGDNLIDMDILPYHYSFRVFIPEEPEMQEQYWLAKANIQNPDKDGSFRGYYCRSYFYYSKTEMIFYTDVDLLKLYSVFKKSKEFAAYQDPWTLRTIFFGEPFKSPINTALWKVLDGSNYYLRIPYPW